MVDPEKKLKTKLIFFWKPKIYQKKQLKTQKLDRFGVGWVWRILGSGVSSPKVETPRFLSWVRGPEISGFELGFRNFQVWFGFLEFSDFCTLYLYCWIGMTNPSYLRWDQAQPLGWRYWPIGGAPHRYWYCLCWSCSRRVCYLLSIQSSHDWTRRNCDSNWDLFLLWPKFFLRWSG